MTALSALLSALLPVARANERPFTYTYDTLTLPRGAREIEPWTTVSTGKQLALSQRVELEWGITDRLMTAFYFNWAADREHAVYEGVSSEWKYRLLSGAVDPIGLALYGEASIGPLESELECKLLVDKQVGSVVLAYNLVGEQEWEAEDEGDGEIEWEQERKLNNHIGAAWRSSNWSLGIEATEVNEFKDGELHEVKVGAGPAVGFVAQGWWVASTAMVWFAEKEEDRALEVEPALEIRTLLGFDF